jgi:hypothetical protein
LGMVPSTLAHGQIEEAMAWAQDDLNQTPRISDMNLLGHFWADMEAVAEEKDTLEQRQWLEVLCLSHLVQWPEVALVYPISWSLMLPWNPLLRAVIMILLVQ